MKKEYALPGQRRDTPPETDSLRKFYASLRTQRPDSVMAEEWLLVHGLLPAADAQRAVAAQAKRRGRAAAETPQKGGRGRPSAGGSAKRGGGKKRKAGSDDDEPEDESESEEEDDEEDEPSAKKPAAKKKTPAPAKKAKRKAASSEEDESEEEEDDDDEPAFKVRALSHALMPAATPRLMRCARRAAQVGGQAARRHEEQKGAPG